MVGAIQTIWLLEFHGEGLEDQKKNLFICEKIWEAKHITDENTKVVQLAIIFRDHTLDWYMGLIVNSPQGSPTTITDVNKELINEFQRPSLED
jgi:hypothetical protein